MKGAAPDLPPARIDPYLAWAEYTGYRDYFAPNARRTLAVVLECKKDVADLLREIERHGLKARVSPLYLAGGMVYPGRFCTASVDAAEVSALVPLVERIELGTAIDTRAPVDFIDGQRRKARAVVGVIDDFVAFGHPSFEGHGPLKAHSRVSYVWSQDLARPRAIDPALWTAPSIVGYGYELSSLVPSAGPAPTLRELRRAYPPQLVRRSHGTAIAYIAAGNGRLSHKPRDDSDVDIVAVNLPRATVADTSGGALKVQALEALHYIVRRAGFGMPVVVNFSYGTMAGPHDGSSLLEQAIDELIEIRQGLLTVVLPAGNAYQLQAHARFDLKAAASKVLHWRVPPDCQTPTFLEVWVPAGREADLHLEVTDPGGVTVTADAGQPLQSDAPGPLATFGVVYTADVSGVGSATKVLIALAPTGTVVPRSKVLARHGLWRVRLKNRSAQRLDGLHAWIERNDSVRGQPHRGMQSYFVDRNYWREGQQPGEMADNPSSPVQRAGSYNSIGNGANTVVIGGYEGRIADQRVSAYSGGGPLRTAVGQRKGPETLAPSDESRQLPGLRVAGNETADTVRVNGTSVAAPQVTRLIAKWLAADPTLTLTQIRQRLATASKQPVTPVGGAARTAYGWLDC